MKKQQAVSISVDVIPVRGEDEATALMVYHLAMAQSYFEATHDDGGRQARAVIRSRLPELSQDTACSFVSLLVAAYNDVS